MRDCIAELAGGSPLTFGAEEIDQAAAVMCDHLWNEHTCVVEETIKRRRISPESFLQLWRDVMRHSMTAGADTPEAAVSLRKQRAMGFFWDCSRLDAMSTDVCRLLTLFVGDDETPGPSEAVRFYRRLFAQRFHFAKLLLPSQKGGRTVKLLKACDREAPFGHSTFHRSLTKLVVARLQEPGATRQDLQGVRALTAALGHLDLYGVGRRRDSDGTVALHCPKLSSGIFFFRIPAATAAAFTQARARHQAPADFFRVWWAATQTWFDTQSEWHMQYKNTEIQLEQLFVTSTWNDTHRKCIRSVYNSIRDSERHVEAYKGFRESGKNVVTMRRSRADIHNCHLHVNRLQEIFDWVGLE